MNILIYGNPMLRRRARSLRRADKSTIALLDDMMHTMRQAPGVGLAAPQVGQALRIIVAAVDELDYRLINPKIVRRAGSVEGTEGCLSLPALYGTVERPEAVTVKALTERMKPVTIRAEGFLARVLSHEIDHLSGKLFIDQAIEESLHWLVPDDQEESGYRSVRTTVAEATERFDRLRKATSVDEDLADILAVPHALEARGL
ncbi:MAG: peptide deformylase [Armatimonadota bacterium]